MGIAHLLELNLGLELLNRLLNDWVLLIKHIDHELWSIEAERVCRWIISSKLRRNGWDSGRSQNPVRGFSWRCVSEQIVGSSDLKLIGWVSLSQDFFEEGKLPWVSILDQVSSDGVERCHIHVAVGVEVVDEFDLVDVLEDKVTHCSGLRLREGEWTGERLAAGVLLCAEVAVREAIVSVEVYSSVCVVSAEPLPSPRVILILSLHHVVGRLEEGLLDIEDAVDVEDRDDVESHVLQQINVVLIVVDHSVEELEYDIEGHLDRDCLSCVMSASHKQGWPILCGLGTRLELNQRDVTTLVCLAEAGDFDVFRELFSELLDDH